MKYYFISSIITFLLITKITNAQDLISINCNTISCLLLNKSFESHFRIYRHNFDTLVWVDTIVKTQLCELKIPSGPLLIVTDSLIPEIRLGDRSFDLLKDRKIGVLVVMNETKKGKNIVMNLWHPNDNAFAEILFIIKKRNTKFKILRYGVY